MKIRISDLDKLNSPDPKVKYGFAKELLKIGANDPGSLYKYFDRWAAMMKGNNNILKWTAIDIIGHLSLVDKDNKTDQNIGYLLKLLHGGHLITCNHSIFALGLIAKNKPNNKRMIIRELVSVVKDTFETDECKNIAIGKVLVTLLNFTDEISEDNQVLAFIRQARNNSRNATRKKADLLFEKINQKVLSKAKT